MPRTGIAFAALVLFSGGCTSGANGTGDGGLSCRVGGSCSHTQVCMGGVAGCTSNCQCLGGIWQEPCPTDAPEAGTACNPSGLECGYSLQPNPCGAANCNCQGGVWSCGPTCALSGDASVDAGWQRCGSDGDCGPNYACAYSIARSCTAVGVCLPLASCGGAGKQPTYCGCDGGAFVRRCDLPWGYSQAPVLSGVYPPCVRPDAGDASTE